MEIVNKGRAEPTTSVDDVVVEPSRWPETKGGWMGLLQHVSEVGGRAGDYSTTWRDFSAPWRARKANEPKMAVRTTDKSKRSGYNKLSGNSRLPTLVVLCFAALLLLTSCGGEQPSPPLDTPIPEGPSEIPSPSSTPTKPVNPSSTLVPTPTMGPAPAATRAASHAATEVSDGERDSYDRVMVAVQQLFDTWNRALRDDDATLFHSVLTRELAGSCRLDDLQSWLDQDEEFLAEAMVTAVFLDVTDPTRAFAELVAGQGAGRPEESISFPWPVALEDGEWRSGFPGGLTARECPYIAASPPSGTEDGEREFPQIPGLDLEQREDILAAVPGTRVVRGSIRTRNSGSSFSSGGSLLPYDNHVNIHAELETESTVGEVVRLYREGLIHPTWEIIDESSSTDFGWFSWAVPDTEGRLWHGRLVVAPLHEGWKQVWLSLYSNEADESQ